MPGAGTGRLFAAGGSVPPYTRYAMSFNGSNKYAATAVPGNTNPLKTDAFTASAWVYPTALNGQGIIGNGSAAGRGWVIALDATGAVFWRLGSAIAGSDYISVLTTAADVALNAWQHVAVSYDGSVAVPGVKVYVSAALRTVASSTNGLTGITSGTNGLVVGAFDSGGPSSFHTGLIADPAYHNRVLTAGEIATHAAQPFVDLRTVAATSSALRGYWRPESTDGPATVADLSVSASNLTTYNMTGGDFVAL